ncbi:DUF5683 domain-containing protein [Jejudonia soesokkakensis]|uniref:DUF5683 domain-containing protein n=1 Tax=Jejudonia soesokkakensis TaxID=1323432 RepID=A0ABW2MTJ6_9FLAO
MKNKGLYILFLFISAPFFAQETDSLSAEKTKKPVLLVEESTAGEYDPLAPSRAAFYSAVVPGLGQAYNKKYWKIPIIYAGMATGIYFYIDQNNDYNRFRDAYKRRLAGFTDDEFYGDGATPQVSNARLIDAQRSTSRNKDYSIIATLLVYVLNIIDANVDAHLQQFNIGEDLSLETGIDINAIQSQPHYGLSLRLKLK